MGTRRVKGRKPKPSGLRLAEGNLGKRAIPAEPPVKRGAPERPEWLEGEALKEWDRIVPQLEAAGLLAHVDRAALAAYCETWARFVDETLKAKKTGSLVKTPNGYPVTSPHYTNARQAARDLKDWAEQFGLSPSARARVKAGPAPAEAEEAKPLWARKRTA